MTKQPIENNAAVESEPRRRRFPLKMVSWTVLVILLAIAGRIWSGTLAREWGVDPAMGHVIPLLLIFATWFFWIIWALAFSAFSVWVRLGLALAIAAVGVAFPILFEFDQSGDLRLSHFRLRNWGPRTVAQVTGEANIEFNEVEPHDFPGFLGRERNAVVNNVRLSTDWTATPPRLLWEVPVDAGWSGVAIVQGHVFTMEQRGTQECVTCYDIKDGRGIWRYENPQRHDDVTNAGRLGPRSTPVFDSGKIYAQGATGTLLCLDAQTGKLIWKAEIDALVNANSITRKSLLSGEEYRQEPLLSWGRAASPLIINDLVVTTGGGPDADTMVTLLAFDKETGAERWRAGEEMIGYGSPSYAVIAGVPQILLVAESTALGFAPEGGEPLWKAPWPGSSSSSANCSQVTVVSDNHVLLSKGYQAGSKLLLIEPEGNQLQANEVWANPRALRTKLTNPVILDGHAYGLSDGFLDCVRMTDGKIVWKERSRAGNGQLLLVGEHLLIHTEDGQMLLADASPGGYRQHGVFPTVEGTCWNTFGISGTTVIVRSDREMACFELAGERL